MTSPSVVYPQNWLGTLHFRWIDAFFSKWHFVLFIVVDRGHFFDDPQEDWDRILREMGSGVSRRC